LQYLGAARIGHGEQAQEQVLRADEVMPELERLAHRVLQHPPGPGRERMREMVRACRWEPAYS